MQRIFYLAKILRKCTGTGVKGAEEVSGKTMDIVMYIIMAVIFAAMFFVGRMLGAWAFLLGDPANVFQSFFMLGSVVSLFLTIPGMINTLYMSSDMGVLLTLPLTANEIVSARVVNLLKLPVLISLVVTIAPGIGYFTTSGVVPEIALAMLVAFVCMPIIVISILGIVVVLLMSVVKGLRSRDSLKIIGAVALIIIFAIYIVAVRYDYNQEAIKQISQTVSKFDGIFPINFALGYLMAGKSFAWAFAALAITAALAVVFVIVVKKFYLSAALSMQDTSSSYGIVSDKKFAKSVKKHPLVKTVVIKELKMTGRNPAYLLTGYLYPIFMPLLTTFALLFTSSSIVDIKTGDAAVDTFFIFTLVTPLMVSLGVSSCAVVTTAISREGADFMLLRVAPVKLESVVKAKKIAGFIVGAGPSLVYVLIGGAILVHLHDLQIWGILYGVVIAALIGIIGVNLHVSRDLKKPNLVWDDEAQMIKSAGGALTLIFLLICLVGGIGIAILGTIVTWTMLFALLVIAICVIFVILTGMNTKKWTGKVATQLKMR